MFIFWCNIRFIFYEILKKTNKFIDITLKDAKKLKVTLEQLKNEKNHIEALKIHKDLATLIANINNDNYNDIIQNLRDIRKNISIDNSIDAIEKYLDSNLNEIENNFSLLLKYETAIFLLQSATDLQ